MLTASKKQKLNCLDAKHYQPSDKEDMLADVIHLERLRWLETYMERSPRKVCEVYRMKTLRAAKDDYRPFLLKLGVER